VVLDLHAEGLGPSSHFLVILSVDSTLVVIERCFVLPVQYRPCPGYREPCPGGHDRWWSLLATCLSFEQKLARNIHKHTVTDCDIPARIAAIGT
jgi:hypothetical protein